MRIWYQIANMFVPTTDLLLKSFSFSVGTPTLLCQTESVIDEHFVIVFNRNILLQLLCQANGMKHL